jgi:hypothetical protein
MNPKTISYIIRQVFEANQEASFTDQLKTYIDRKNTEIERVCSLNYQVIVSILIPRNLSNVRSSFARLNFYSH